MIMRPLIQGHPRLSILLVVGVITVATTLAYSNIFDAPFVLDDLTSITTNPTIRQLWPLDQVLATPRGTGNTVDGRPLLNLSFALNHAFGGVDPRGYHAVNLVIHVLNGCLLFALVRRTLLQPVFAPRFTAAALPLAAACAWLWALHPLTTAAVTYTAQRAESLMAFWFLLTLYAFVRSIEASHPIAWRSFAAVACFAGAATKEVMAAAPLVVLLYDRTFVAGSFRAAFRARGITHAMFAASWLLIAWLALGSGDRGGTAGLTTGISSWDYLLTQCGALLRYLRLAFWPTPLVFDHGASIVTRWSDVWPQALALIVLFATTLWALWRKAAMGFVGAAFLLILAPSSSVIPVATQTVAEHRMYLPLVACVALTVMAGARWLGWRVVFTAAMAIAPVLAIATYQRNADYRSEIALWRDTVQKRPDNARAFLHLGMALVRARDEAGALEAFAASARLAPQNSEVHTNLGNLHFAAGRVDQAIREHTEAVRLRPDSAPTHASLGFALLAAERPADALPVLQEAWRIDPDLAGLEGGLGLTLLQLSRPRDALPHLERAVQLKPDDVEAHYNLANALIALQRPADAIRSLQTALHVDASHVPTHNNLGNLLLLARRPEEAVPHFIKVVQRYPDSAPAHTNLGLALLLMNDRAGAETQFREALRLDPNYAPARTNLERLRSSP